MLRRISTNRRGVPHRGEEFSVDDDASEVEEERETFLTPQRPAIMSRQTSTIRRRPAHQVTPLPRVDSQEEEEEEAEAMLERSMTAEPRELPHSGSDTAHEELEETPDEIAEEEEEDVSDAESFTLKDKQQAINQTHPFGIRIWKPALYKKSRSVEKGAEEDIHSSPSAIVSRWLWFFNCLWTLFFGWWLSLTAVLGAVACFIFAFDSSAVAYGRVLWGLAGYLFWPFGQFVKLKQDDRYADEDEGEGRSISEYERWQSGDLEYGRLMFGPTLTHTGSIVGRRRNSVDSSDDERESLLGRTRRGEASNTDVSNRKRRLFGRGEWTLGRVIFFLFFYLLIAPLMLLVSGICWFMVFWIPMGRVTLILFYHLRKRPLALSFHPDVASVRSTTNPQAILLCTYRAVGLKYWKYTVDGTNIILINFLVVVGFAIFDYLVLDVALGLENFLTSPALMFPLALVSIIPLAYFIGQAVASISAQSSMGLGAAVNAFFSTIVEVYLYCIALNEGKGKLVEGSVIGSIFAGVLLLPGLSMCFGAFKRKTQRFNQKSAGATTTMLLFATIAAFGPTLFYKIYGAHELICRSCSDEAEHTRDCRQCYFRQVPAISDDFFVDAVRPYTWAAAVFLFSSYVIGLLFTLRTHAAVIWSTDDEKKPIVAPPTLPPTTDISPKDTRLQSIANGQTVSSAPQEPQVTRPNIRESQLYDRIYSQTVRQAGLQPITKDVIRELPSLESSFHEASIQGGTVQRKSALPYVVPPKSSRSTSIKSPRLKPVMPGLSEEDNNSLLRQVAEMAATAATYAARDAVNHPRTTSYQATHLASRDNSTRIKSTAPRPSVQLEVPPVITGGDTAGHDDDHPGGHDAANWSKAKSSIILLTATFAYAIIAEILVNTVDVVLNSVDISEKFLGITLFALVPSTTEFLNAISFAMNGNVSLSMEIGSAYALQVILLQIPALVVFSAVRGQFIDPGDLIDHTFQLIFPQWDMVTVILCVFLLSYVYSEGKSNYFKGSIMVMTYVVVLLGFHYSSFTTMDIMGVDPSNTLAIIGSTPWRPQVAGAGGYGGLGKSEL